MKTTRTDNYLLVENENEPLTDFISELTRHHKDFKLENVIVDLSNYEDLDSQNLLGFLEISNLHRSENRSFVIINNSMGLDELPEELILVPTMQEAEDMIQMDEIQRDLGF